MFDSCWHFSILPDDLHIIIYFCWERVSLSTAGESSAWSIKDKSKNRYHLKSIFRIQKEGIGIIYILTCIKNVGIDTMVKQLKDVCLTKIQHSLDKLQNVGDRIPNVYKEVLLERLAWHELFTENYIPHIAKILFSPSLTKVNFYKCEQIDDRVLSLLGSTGCKLESIKVNACTSITGKTRSHVCNCQWYKLLCYLNC